MIYLDNAATTQPYEEVVAVMYPYIRVKFGNPETRYYFGRDAEAAVEKARVQVAKAINAVPEEIYFMSGGTEANNCVLCSFKGGLIVTPKTEHHSVLRCAEFLETQGTSVIFLPVNSDGVLSEEPWYDTVKGDSGENRLVSVMMANNETGTLQDIKKLANWAHSYYYSFHTDATQAFGKVPIDVRELDVDYMTLSAHKIHGPKGAGIVYIKRDAQKALSPLLHGGAQEDGLRAGTLNVPAIVGFGEAAARINIMLEGMTEQRILTEKAFDKLCDQYPQAVLNGAINNRLPNTLNIRLGVECATLVALLDKQDICIACGSACSAKKVEPSHVLTAMGLTVKDALGSIRLTTRYDTTDLELSTAVCNITLAAYALKEKGE